MEFATLNKLDICGESFAEHPICTYARLNRMKVNLIYGIEYASPEDLISSFDIRACSMAIDPATKILYVVSGSLEDLFNKTLVFNPVPRSASVARLIKYVGKGLEPSPYQRLFFAELIKSGIYSADIELKTGLYPTVF